MNIVHLFGVLFTSVISNVLKQCNVGLPKDCLVIGTSVMIQGCVYLVLNHLNYDGLNWT